MALIFAVGGTEKALVLGVREAACYPFVSPLWTDLRLGLWLSITGASNPDLLTGLTESLSFSTSSDRMWLGFKNNSNDTFPKNTGVDFMGLAGYPNGSTCPAIASAVRNSRDYWYSGAGGSGGTAPNYCPFSVAGVTETIAGQIFDIAFPNNNSVGAGYALYYSLKLTRASGTGTTVTCTMRAPSSDGQINRTPIATATPDIASLRNNLVNAAYDGNTVSGGHTDGSLNAVFLYWPYRNSRLRVHAMVLEKFAP